MNREAWIVLDLGFGDAGKGTLTDFLVRERGASLVVRFNGGAQAGHNVVAPDGRHHTFSQFGAGTLAGARGLLGPDFVLHPLGMEVEAEHLERAGIDPWPLTEVDRRARVITPYQQAAGRIRELLRGDAAHGTTGLGVGERVRDGLRYGDDAVCAADLGDADVLRRHLGRQRERKRAELVALGASGEALDLFDDDGLIDRVVAAWGHVAGRLRLLSPEQTLARVAAAARVVFEGAQGVLLDEDWGFHPHTTWGDCTPAGALRLAGDREVVRLGVTRAYMVRHGAGPLPTELDVDAGELHNADEGWQGRFRVGGLDGVLLRYALSVCGGVDGLAVTCLDRPELPVTDAYEGPAPAGLASGEPVRALSPGEPGDLEHRRQLGAWLKEVAPVRERREVVGFVQDATGVPVWLEGRGPRPSDKRWRRRFGALDAVIGVG